MKTASKSSPQSLNHNLSQTEQATDNRLQHVSSSTSSYGTNRRRFLQGGMIGAGAMALGAGLSPSRALAFQGGDDDDKAPITRGDIAILRFLHFLETIETDLWQQYSELGGIQDNEVSGINGGNVPYIQALALLDADMALYIHDNADDEIGHPRFLGKYIESIGAEQVDLSPFAQLPSSKADGARQVGRLTSDTPKYWRTQVVIVMDGGDCYWQALYDPATDRYSEFTINGRA